MSRISQYARVLNHRLTTSGEQFTIPTSNDHTDETWVKTDLYIGEIGINVVDDTIYMRTNNGIIQISASASGSATASSNQWSWNSPYIQIGATYSADGVTPRSGYYTDLGSSTDRWKDLYLGGATNSRAGIDFNNGLSIASVTGGVLTYNFQLNDNAPIKIYATVSNSVNMDQPIAINSKDVYFQGGGNQRAMVASNGVIMYTASNTFIAGSNVVINNGISEHVHLGPGMNRTNYYSSEVVAGGSLAVRGVADDGSTQYDRSDWRTTQDLLRTTNALTTNIATIPWGVTGLGNVMQVKAYLIGSDINDSQLVYSSEILGCYSLEPNGVTASEIGTQIVNEMSSWPSTQPNCEMSADADNVYIKVTGLASTTIQWLVTYSIQQLTNI